MTQISQHFTLEELTASDDAAGHHWDNDPDDVSAENLALLCNELLEPVRALLGVPIRISSGYRCAQLNEFVGGAADSAHLFGLAADTLPQGLTLDAAFASIKASAIAFDQLIIEANDEGAKWLHIALPNGSAARRQCLVGNRVNGSWVYAEA